MVDFGALPPEINSARMYAGPGSASLVAAAQMWDSVASDLFSAASAFQSVVWGLTVGSWIGSSAGRTRGCLLRSTPETSRRLRSQIRESPDSPGRFKPAYHGAPLRPVSGAATTLVSVRILVVDDDRAVRESLRRSLSFNGYSVELAHDGVEALDMIASDRPDALVLDVMMPRLDGLEVCRQLRSTGDDLPILVLTARDSVSERVAGLDAGADDYLPKPFALEELLARMRALLRRTKPEDAAESMAMRFSDLTLDPVTREVNRGQRRISLTRTEFALLEMLIANPRRVLTRSRILEEVWGFDFPTSGNALEVYVGYLRRKTEADGEPRLIHTVRGVGYVLRETPP